MRSWAVIINIMRDIPRQDTQPETHSHLVICKFKLFFSLNDLRPPSDASWSTTLQRVEHDSSWDPRSRPFRLNVAGILEQRLAADEESAKRRADASAASPSQPNSNKLLNAGYDDDSAGTTSVLIVSRITQAVVAFINDVLDLCLTS
ncbi:MAG: hypothetical protein ABJL35_03630 [Parasphingorhabdus sp.]|uniref:hypothetical protein n=1 Tax=Parasphingorhabdus sp. TaxID=2709688 RepID=UPI0032971ADC